jgi:hypothetical protein
MSTYNSKNSFYYCFRSHRSAQNFLVTPAERLAAATLPPVSRRWYSASLYTRRQLGSKILLAQLFVRGTSRSAARSGSVSFCFAEEGLCPSRYANIVPWHEILTPRYRPCMTPRQKALSAKYFTISRLHCSSQTWDHTSWTTHCRDDGNTSCQRPRANGQTRYGGGIWGIRMG